MCAFDKKEEDKIKDKLNDSKKKAEAGDPSI